MGVATNWGAVQQWRRQWSVRHLLFLESPTDMAAAGPWCVLQAGEAIQQPTGASGQAAAVFHAKYTNFSEAGPSCALQGRLPSDGGGSG